MKKINIKIPGWAIVTAIVIVAILTVGLANTFASASGRFNLPLSWILTPSGTSVDTDNDGIIDNVDAGVLSGSIAMWSGSYNDIPNGWQLCDGTNSTPDLRNKFVYGVNTSYGSGNDGDLGTTGGATSHSHTYSDLPQHNHTATISPNPHSHTYDKSQRSANYVGSTGGSTEHAHDGFESKNTTSVDLSVTVSETGVDSPSTDTASSLPPHYKLAYIMKL